MLRINNLLKNNTKMIKPKLPLKSRAPISSYKQFPAIEVSKNFFDEQQPFADKVETWRMLCKPSTLGTVIGVGAFPELFLKTIAADNSLGNKLPYLTFISLLGYVGGLLSIFKEKKFIENATSTIPFSQQKFDKTIISHFPKLKFMPKGNCMGHTNMWFRHSVSERNYLEELEGISSAIGNKQKLNSPQLKLLKMISAYQHSVQFVFKTNNPREFAGPIHFIRQRYIDLIIDKAMQNPNKLFVFTCYARYWEFDGHCIGVHATPAKEIKVFDPNLGEYIFNDALSAKIGLSRLYAYTYSIYQPHMQAYMKEPISTSGLKRK